MPKLSNFSNVINRVGLDFIPTFQFTKLFKMVVVVIQLGFASTKKTILPPFLLVAS